MSGVYVIIGAASGMGLATARRLSLRGETLILCDINRELLECETNDLATAFLKLTIDVTNRDSVKSAVYAIKRLEKKVLGLANFAGTGGHELGFESIWETTDTEFDFIMNVNVRGLFNVLKETLAGDHSFYSEREFGGSSIVHIGSQFSERGFKKGAVFAASKHAALGLISSTALETSTRGIRLNIVLPGAIDTPMHQENVQKWAGKAIEGASPGLQIPLGRPGIADEVASVVEFLLGRESSYVTGAAWRVDGGANAN